VPRSTLQLAPCVNELLLSFISRDSYRDRAFFRAANRRFDVSYFIRFGRKQLSRISPRNASGCISCSPINGSSSKAT